MEIHKLGDFVSDAKGEASLKITDIRQAVKNENRVNIFVNGEYSFSLDVAQVVDLGVKKGLVVSEERLAEFKKASEFGKLYQRALEWVLVRPRSTRETRDYLCRKVREKKLDSNYIDEIIDKLTSKKYLEDEKFTQYYVENRFVKKGISSKRLKMELMKKGISHEVIERVMSETGRNDEDEIRKMIMKKRGRYDDEKLIQYLCRQGFQFEMVRNLVHEMDLQNLE
ncbi:RecX family transcriptional regulator [Candidatus Saccharibacteria bacterium]|nr:RecX family transcriptional regulator [Candidatus Saccharibacteria bacterium]